MSLLLAEELSHIEELESGIELLNEEVEQRCLPFVADIERADTIPGVGLRIAQDVLAEIGPDRSRFSNPGHLASWGRMCLAATESMEGPKAAPSALATPRQAV